MEKILYIAVVISCYLYLHYDDASGGSEPVAGGEDGGTFDYQLYVREL